MTIIFMLIMYQVQLEQEPDISKSKMKEIALLIFLCCASVSSNLYFNVKVFKIKARLVLSIVYTCYFHIDIKVLFSSMKKTFWFPLEFCKKWLVCCIILYVFCTKPLKFASCFW